ncbi:MAG: CBS domain-containing protein [Planctomycetes bacterium]|nr:CBS domain-containing protein [Planctomycetota bacterium]
MFLRDILHRKGTEVQTIAPGATLAAVIEQLIEFNIGSLVVCEMTSTGSARMIGIITERDLLRTIQARRGPFERLTVSEIMSPDLVTASPDDGLEDAMQLTTYRRVRHLPIVDEDQLLGIVSIGDIVKVHHDRLVMENYYMRSYIQGEGAEVGTMDWQ